MMLRRLDRWRQRACALGAWISFWRSLTWRQRNGLWICWAALDDDEERAIFKARVVAGIFDAYNAARHKRHVLDPATSKTFDDVVTTLEVMHGERGQPTSAALAAAPVIEQWHWSPTDSADLFVRGQVDGQDRMIEAVELDTSRRWVRDRGGKLWRLGSQQSE